MNIPARYVNGYLGDIGIPVTGPMDFSAWMEVFLDGRWHTFDPRNNKRRIGRIMVAYGRDAADVPLIHSFGPHILQQFHRLDRRDPRTAAAQRGKQLRRPPAGGRQGDQLATSSPSTRWIATTAGRGRPPSLKSGQRVVSVGCRLRVLARMLDRDEQRRAIRRKERPRGLGALRAGEKELRQPPRRAFGIDTIDPVRDVEVVRPVGRDEHPALRIEGQVVGVHEPAVLGRCGMERAPCAGSFGLPASTNRSHA